MATFYNFKATRFVKKFCINLKKPLQNVDLTTHLLKYFQKNTVLIGMWNIFQIKF